MPPRRVWDLYSNRVVPQGIVTEKKPWAISYAWMDPEHLPIHINGSLDLVRIEMLRLGAEYIWLDVLCLRRHRKEENEPLREEEWKLDVPTSGYVYHETEIIVYYFCGLGGAFSLTMDDLHSSRFLMNRAWTLQEISRKWIIAGVTSDGAVATPQTAAEQDYKVVLDRIHKQLGLLVDIVHRVDNVFDLLMHHRKRQSEHAVDHVAALVFPLRFKEIPTYDETQSVEDLWLAVVNTMRKKHRGDLFFLYPTPGSERTWRPSWNQVITEQCLPEGNVNLYADVERHEETDSDWYDRMCIEEGRVQGLSAEDPKGSLRHGKLVVKDKTGTLHSLEVVAAHLYDIPDDSYKLIASGQRKNGAFVTRAPSTEIHWVAGRRLPEQKFEKVSVFTMRDAEEIQMLKKLRITKRSIQNYLV
ncbi:uncharacterized protein EV420DRAFT_1647113 [Desarmillaria tabescens]|uniref:Heterokaryon incompatibility domain-containing protein n=1 Tax=Armillaria tabescens TaxID=1929756 RepID=A0AA39JUC2_ARMTA|nr:uncharacterized protein EV420DRAFT_1647113 [Desarmillaria tabescens]KAK0449080.1 hypothetical protein EV420DRAFT_1647113 [Desarmillaria tabescens]